MATDRSLTPIEKLTAAHAYFVLKIDQHKIAALMNVNAGRIAEAVSAAKKVFRIEHASKTRKLRDR